jgi:UDPglucose 6-dehydrogenase
MRPSCFDADAAMNIAVIGCGYVGLVTGACLAEMGNTVTCIDSDAHKLAQLQMGLVPFFEPGLESLLQQNAQARTGLDILAAVAQANEIQKQWASGVIASRFGHRLHGRRFAVWGLSFKPDTDDLREAPSLAIIADLIAAGAQLRAHDPVAMPRARREWPQAWFDTGALQLVDSPLAAVEGADALVLVTEWKPFRSPDFAAIAARMRGRLIVDGRNQYDPAQLRAMGFDYAGVGRGAVRLSLPTPQAEPAGA